MPHPHRRSRACAAVLLLAFAAPSLALPARALAEITAEDRAAAAALKKKGDTAMDKLDYAGAVAAFTEAYERGKDPAVLYNRGRAHQALGQFPEALRAFEQFAKEAPPALKAKVPKLADLIADMRGKVTTLIVHCDVKGARVVVRERAGAAEAPLLVEAGTATVQVEAEGYVTLRKEVVLPGGKELTLDVQLEPTVTTGVLTVKSPIATALVLVDGAPAGKVPAQQAVAPGTHKVVVRAEGYEEATVSTVVELGATREITVTLEKTPGLTSRWWFWTGVSVVVVGGAVLTWSLLTERSPDRGDFSPGQVAGPLARF